MRKLIQTVWQELPPARRVVLITGVMLVLLATLGLAAWALHNEDQVLFSGLAARDASAMAAELDRIKVPYRVADQGATLLVAADQVHRTRLQLMGHELPLQGAVGFELFNDADFGMTEFAQKVNYQRALQGELTRTILSLAEIDSARVHLVLPEEGVFKRDLATAKASITLGLRPGRHLQPEQISGIQRLVAAAVPAIAISAVTIIDQHGVALTAGITDEGESAAGDQALGLKQQTEQLLARKATQVMERAFGAGQALASVDVTLNLDRMRVTTEDVLAAPAVTGTRAATGVVTHERETLRDAAPLTNTADTGSAQRETDYQTGRRIEQIVSQPGAITRLQVVVVVAHPLSVAQIEQTRALLGAAVGAVAERGDTVVVQTLSALASSSTLSTLSATTAQPEVASSVVKVLKRTTLQRSDSVHATPTTQALTDSQKIFAVGLLIALLLSFLGWTGWRYQRRLTAAAPRPLSPAERQAMLEKLQRWCVSGQADPS